MNCFSKFGMLAAAAGAALTAFPGAASATTATVTDIEFNTPSPFRTGDLFYDVGGSNEILLGGVGFGKFLMTGQYDPSGPAFNLLTYCFEISQSDSSTVVTTYNVVSLAAALSDVTKQSQINALISNGDTNAPGAGTQVAAVQLALWEILNEDFATNGYDLNLGKFYIGDSSTDANSDVRTLANSYLANIVGGSWTANPGTALTVFQNGRYQDQLTSTGVPEPAAWGMMIAGFGMVGGALRRRRSARVTAFA